MGKRKIFLPDNALVLTQKDVADLLVSMDKTDGVFMVPEGVSAISNDAFFNCHSIRCVILPRSVHLIGDGAFRYCDHLEMINLPENLVALGERSFDHCEMLRTISIPKKIKKIPWRAFHSCNNLTSVVLPAGLITIGQEAFRDCSKLVDVTLPKTLRVIGYEAFMSCVNLKHLVLPRRVSNIGQHAFLKCDQLELEVESYDEGIYAKNYVIDWKRRVQEERNAVILCDTSGNPHTALPIQPEDERSWTKVLIQNSVLIKEKPVQGCTITVEVLAPFYCKVGGRFSAQYSDGLFFTAKLMRIASMGTNEATIQAKVLKTGNRLSFVKRLSAIQIKKLIDSCEYHYNTPDGDEHLGLQIRQINDRLICLSNSYGGGDIVTTHFLYTDEDGVDHLVEAMHSDAITDYSAIGDQVLGLHQHRPFQWENGLLINREEKAIWKGAEDLIEVRIPEGIEHIGLLAFVGCAQLKTIELPSSVHSIDYQAIRECRKLKQIRIHASYDSFDEGNLRILYPDVELIYCHDLV